jgi:hypothetical protein
VPDKFKNGETQDSPLDGVYSSECKERVMRFFLLLAELPVEDPNAPKASSPDDLPSSNEGK